MTELTYASMQPLPTSCSILAMVSRTAHVIVIRKGWVLIDEDAGAKQSCFQDITRRQADRLGRGCDDLRNQSGRAASRSVADLMLQ